MYPTQYLMHFATLLVLTTADHNKYNGDQLWRIHINDDKHIDHLQKITKMYEIDTWLPLRHGHPYDIHIAQSQIDDIRRILNKYEISYQVLQSNLGQVIRQHYATVKHHQQRANSLAQFDYTIYHPAEEIYEWIDLVVSEVSYASKIQYGVTYQGRPLYALKLSKNDDDDDRKPTIYVDSLTHSREWITAAASMYAFNQIMFNATFEPMIDNTNWIFVPMVNIDGYLYTWSEDGDRLWRQTRSIGASETTFKGKCMGADPNRNWEIHWSELLSASEDPCSFLYHGKEPNSEPEIRHLSNFILQKSNVINAVVSLHSYAQVIVFPFNYQQGIYPTNSVEQNSTAAAMSEAIKSLHGKEYKYGAAAEILYEATGVTTDWTQQVAGVDINYTIELRDTGEYGFLLPPQQIIPTGEELLAALQVLNLHVGGS